jgi:ribonuclease Y
MTFAPWVVILVALGAAAVAFLGGWIAHRRIGEGKVYNAEQLAAKIVREAEKEAENQKKSALLEAKDEWFREKAKIDREVQSQKSEIQGMDRRLHELESNLNRRAEVLDKKERDQKRLERELEVRGESLTERDKELARVLTEQNARLQRISGMTMDEAKAMLIANMENEAKSEAAKRLQEIREDTIRNAEKEAREIVTLAIQRCAADHSAESTVSVVHLPNDEMKGRIIGREGRNIRALEQATGVDLIIDDTPESVVLSGFDPVRREIARLALTKLIGDGRIHPGRIEEVVSKAKAEVDLIIRQAGETAAYESGVPGLPPEIIKLLGRLKFRTSYGQNVLMHVVETSHLAAVMLTESLFGNHKGFKNALFVQLGPGLGMGTFIDGRIYRGCNFRVGLQDAKPKPRQPMLFPLELVHVQYVFLQRFADRGCLLCDANLERFLAAGMDAYVAKPLQARELLAVIRRATAEAQPPANPAASIDEGLLLERVADDRRALRMLVALFLADAPKLMTQIRLALGRGDARALQAAAHTLKGSVSNFAAPAATAAALRLQRLAEAGDMAGARTACASLARELRSVRGALTALIGKEPRRPEHGAGRKRAPANPRRPRPHTRGRSEPRR